MIWAIMKQRVKKQQPQTKEELQKVITAVWNELDQGLLDRMILDFRKRIEMVIKARGRSISPYLSSHRSEPTAEDAAANKDFRPFEATEDEAILGLVYRIGNRWKRIAEILEPQFGHRERTEIKHRAKWLMDSQANQQKMKQLPEAPAEEEAAFDPGEFFTGPAFPKEDELGAVKN
jgi:hypothetical protein